MNTASLVEHARKFLLNLSGAALLTLNVDADPDANCRPRFFRRTGATYYAKGYGQYLSECQKQLARQLPADGPLTGRFLVLLDTRVARPKTTKLTEPRPDVDNLAKAPLDGATKAGVWGDDSQAVAVFSFKRWCDVGEVPGCRLDIMKAA